MKKALLVIDMQIMPFVWKDYGGKAIYREQELIANVKHLLNKARQADAPVYYILYTETGESPRVENGALWPVHPEIAPQPGDKLVIKYHADSFLHTELEQLLKAEQITDLVFCGVQTEFCVDTTVKSAFSRGFNCELVMDAHSTYDSDILSAQQIISHHNSTLPQFAKIIEAAQIDY